MRELSAVELQAVAGGALTIVKRPTEPPIVRIIVKVLEDLIKRLEGGNPKPQPVKF